MHPKPQLVNTEFIDDPSSSTDGARRDGDLVRRASSGQQRAFAEIVERLYPVIERRVRAALRGSRRDAAGPESRDVVQDVWLLLLERDGGLLRAWDCRRGVSLDSYVGAIAWKFARATLRTAFRRTRLARRLSSEVSAPSCEAQVAARTELVRVGRLASTVLSSRSQGLFLELVLANKPTDEVCRDYSVSSSSVYAFLCRARQLLGAEPKRGRGPNGRGLGIASSTMGDPSGCRPVRRRSSQHH